MVPSRGSRNALILQFGLSLLFLSKQVAAQPPVPVTPQQSQSAPDCVAGWNLFMDSGYNPCQGVIDAMTACAGTYTLPDINVQALSLFPVPSRNDNTTTCECNEVSYNLFQACAACQLGANTTLSRRQAWFVNCPSTQTQPPGFIENTFWATQVYNPIFSVPLAVQAELDHQPPPSQSVDSSSALAATAIPTAESASSSMGGGSNKGAIIGGVIGGVVLLSVIIICIVFYMRRKRSRTAPSKEFMQYAPVNQAIIPPHDEESGSFHNQNLQSSQQLLPAGGQQQQQRNSAALRQDSGFTDEMETLPGFTPGLFKDPIFEKGAALNIASHAGYPGGASASPVTYSPATPSTTYHTNEAQRLIQSRQASGS